MKLAVAVAQDKDVLQAVHKASAMGLIEPILIGDKKNNRYSRGIDISKDCYKIINEKDE